MKSKFILASVLLFMSLAAVAQPKFRAITDTTKTVAERYFKNYARLGFDSMAVDMANEYSFEDPTARIIFQGLRINGKEQALENFKKVYTFFNVSLPVNRSYFSGNYGVFEGVYKFSVNAPNNEVMSFELPIVVIIKVENGKVTEHRDYADYQAYLAQSQKEMARIKAKAKGN